MTEVNNPCADLADDCPEGKVKDPETGNCVPSGNQPNPRPTNCPAGQQLNVDTGECEPIPPGPGAPDAVDPEPIQDPPPYPAPFIPINNGQGESGTIIFDEDQPASSAIPPKFLTGTRQITIFTSGCFLTDEIDWREILYGPGREALVKFSRVDNRNLSLDLSSKRPPNHGQSWINQMRLDLQKIVSDPFRWAMFNFWAFNPAVGREGFINRVTGGALSAIAEPDQDMGIQGMQII